MGTQIGNIGIDSEKEIFDAIRAIACHNIIDRRTGATYSGGTVTGFVVKIHTDPSDELCGTVDVREWDVWGLGKGDETEGYHEGVYLSAIQQSDKGIVMVPKLYSDVVVAQDPESGHEYISMFSHVDIIKLDSQKTAVIGVSEREPFDKDGDGTPDIDDVAETGRRARTSYSPEKAVTVVEDEKAGTSSAIESTPESVTVSVGGEKVLTTKEGVWLGTDSGTSHAVLGEELGDILSRMLNLISQIKTTTQLGPQPPMNLAQFVSLKTQIDSWTKSVSRFLSPKINIQKK